MEILKLKIVGSVPGMYLDLTARGLFKSNGDPHPTLSLHFKFLILSQKVDEKSKTYFFLLMLSFLKK